MVILEFSFLSGTMQDVEITFFLILTAEPKFLFYVKIKRV